jgi:tRNA1Val (adenine37-N6)-methyltransferase
MSQRVSGSLVKKAPEERARVVRPAGWTAPGPRPAGDGGDPQLVPSEDEHLSFLTGDFRIFQRRIGHRWSADDFVTAHEALSEAGALGSMQTALDLGCGIGSVLMMLAWGLPSAHLVGVEAQAVSHHLLQRSLRYNGLTDRVRALHGDMRDPELVRGSFDLITGTPPYFPIGHGVMSDKTQKGPCCFETRGGIEDYCEAAARVLAPTGVFVVCEGYSARARVPNAATNAGLNIHRQLEVIPKHGKLPLFDIFVMKRAPASRVQCDAFVIRDARGTITEQMHNARHRMGLPPTQHLERA